MTDHRDWVDGGLRSGGSLQEGSLFGAQWSGMSFLEEVALERSLERWIDAHQVEGWGCVVGCQMEEAEWAESCVKLPSD